MQWDEICELAYNNIKSQNLDDIYIDRLNFEISEILKQGAITKWESYFNDNKKFNSNPNNLVLPWLLGMVKADPIKNRKSPMLNTVRSSMIKKFREERGFIPSDITKDSDMPDIDLDCLPEARDPIKAYAAQKYNADNSNSYGSVCSVGTWQTYKFKNSLIDACAGTGLVDRSVGYEITTKLPEEVDQLKDGGEATCKNILTQGLEEKECGFVHAEAVCPKCGSSATDAPTIGQLLQEYEDLRLFAQSYPDVIDYAVKLVGRIRNMGMHAGALIIADRSLYGNIPMARNSNKGYWVSMWTEGRNAQLSKFGYNKWDILGLKTLKYIFECCKLIEKNRGISFGSNMEGFDYNNPKECVAGWYYDGNNNKCYIDLNDEYALKLANEQKTDGIFQFDTDLAKSILANGVRNFEDLMLFNAMGHPGPMASIPEAVRNRDDIKKEWKSRLPEQIYDILKDTYGVIVYQEQLQAIWQTMAGFTAPEAQEARKAVAKKWVHKLKPIKEKWFSGTTRSMSKKEAELWWEKMETFGRYAFNKSHAVSYCLVAFRCLWLKAHFAPEWWAAVMSDCHQDKLCRYMGIARAEQWKPTPITYSGIHIEDTHSAGIKFDTLNLENMTKRFTVTGNIVNQGLIGIKGIGETAAKKYQGTGNYENIDDFIEKTGGKDKAACERFIKLGAFKYMPGHQNSKALWTWYQYKYCSGKNITELKQKIRSKLLTEEGWNDQTIQSERKRQIEEYKKTYPKRRKIPNKIQQWKPNPLDTREKVMALIKEDFTLSEILKYEEEYLGYYLHSPLDLYACKGDCSIEDAKNYSNKDTSTRLEGVIVSVDYSKTKTDKDFAKIVISDGIQQALVLMWESELKIQNKEILTAGVGVQLYVNYDSSRNIFSVSRNEHILKLKRIS